MNVFAGPDYVEWRRQRLDALRRVMGDGWLHGMRVLELGGGDGSLTLELVRDGARVTMLEGRQGHVDAARDKLAASAAVKRHDLETDIREILPEIFDEPFDVVVHVGLLYHLGDPLRSIREACSIAPLLVLETEVVDSFDPDFRLEHEESPGKPDDGLGPIGVRLSPAAVERELAACGFSFRRVPVEYSSVSGHRYDWTPRGDGSWKPAAYRLMWLAQQEPGVRRPER